MRQAVKAGSRKDRREKHRKGPQRLNFFAALCENLCLRTLREPVFIEEV